MIYINLLSPTFRVYKWYIRELRDMILLKMTSWFDSALEIPNKIYTNGVVFIYCLLKFGKTHEIKSIILSD